MVDKSIVPRIRDMRRSMVHRGQSCGFCKVLLANQAESHRLTVDTANDVIGLERQDWRSD